MPPLTRMISPVTAVFAGEPRNTMVGTTSSLVSSRPIGDIFAASSRNAAGRIAAAPWTDIAAHAGYYDQAHMIAEFHELIGATPTSFLKHGVNRALRWASPDCRTL
jgi:AraC-like DNA-binding protein